MPADLTGDDVGAPNLIPLCAHHRAVVNNLAAADHIDDRESERVATQMRRQCCGRIQ